MLKPRRVAIFEPHNDLLKALTRAGEPIPTNMIAGREIFCSSISCVLALQEFIRRRIKFAITGVEVGNHVAHLSGSTLV